MKKLTLIFVLIALITVIIIPKLALANEKKYSKNQVDHCCNLRHKIANISMIIRQEGTPINEARPSIIKRFEKKINNPFLLTDLDEVNSLITKAYDIQIYPTQEIKKHAGKIFASEVLIECYKYFFKYTLNGDLLYEADDHSLTNKQIGRMCIMDNRQAAFIMKTRQAGISIVEAVSIFKDKWFMIDHHIMFLVFKAYDTPLYDTQEMKEEVIGDFAWDVYVKCKKTLSK